MKYIIPQDKVDKVVFKYLDLKRFEKRKPKYYEGIIFAYPDKEYGVLGYENNGFLYIYHEIINEISSTFGMDLSDSKSIIGRWVGNRYQLEVINTEGEAISWHLYVGNRYQLEVINTFRIELPARTLLAIDTN